MIPFPVITNANLVGYWPLDGDLKDYGSGANHGTASGTTQVALTNSKRARQFDDGDEDTIFIGNDIYSNSTGTICAWAKCRDIQSSVPFDTIFSASDEDGADWFTFQVRQIGTIAVDTYISPGTNNIISGDFDIIEEGSIHFLTVTSDGSEWAMYVDSEEIGYSISAGSNYGGWFSALTSGTSHRFDIGNTYSSFPEVYGMRGWIADLMIFDDVLTQAEIKEIYKATYRR